VFETIRLFPVVPLPPPKPQVYYMVYFAYPYTGDSKKYMEEITALVREIWKKRNDIIPMVPHCVFDTIFGFPLVEGHTHPEVAETELALIARCDYLCFVNDKISTGVLWEMSFAKWLGKPVVEINYFLEAEE